MSSEKLTAQQEAGRLASEIFSKLAELVSEGTGVLEIEQFICKKITEGGMKPAFRGYNGYNFCSCLSLNDTVVHGLPSSRKLQSGDLLTVDLGISNNSWMVDAARTYPIGKVPQSALKLIETAEDALKKAAELCWPGQKISEISRVIAETVEKSGFFIFADLTGHGIGRNLQEPPTVYNIRKSQDATLAEGQTIAIEPIIGLNKAELLIAEDNWSVLTEPPTLSAHVEDTVAATSSGPKLLTRLQ